MIMQIGIVAGDIWHYLDAKGKVKLSELESALGKPHNLTLMSLGWLAREGHVLVEGEDEHIISLRKKEETSNQ